MTAAPILTFVTSAKTDEWHVELKDFKGFRDRLGPDVVNGFARCFVHADRLTSLISFGYLSARHYGEPTPSFHRNLQTMVWFTVGTLRELALSIRGLRSALVRRQMFDPDAKAWQQLRTIESRWEDDPMFRELRSTVSFHVDPEMIEKGLVALEADDSVILSEGRGASQDQSTLRLGLQALLSGTGRSLAELDLFMKAVSQDQGISTTIQEAFILALESTGITVEKEIRDA